MFYLHNRLFFFLILVLAALGIHCCARTFSSCSEWGLLSSCGVQSSRCGGSSCCSAGALGQVGSVIVAHGLNGPVAHGVFLYQGLNP